MWALAILACAASGEDVEARRAEIAARLETTDDTSAGDVVEVTADDPELAAAEAQVRATLDELLADLADPPPGHPDHAIEASFEDGPIVEHMWVGHLRWDGARLHGRLGDTPVDVRNVRGGDEVTVERADVEDWVYDADGRMGGGYAVHVLLWRQPR